MPGLFVDGNDTHAQSRHEGRRVIVWLFLFSADYRWMARRLRIQRAISHAENP